MKQAVLGGGGPDAEMLLECKMAGRVVEVALGKSREVGHNEGVVRETTGVDRVAGEAWGI